MTNGPIDTSGDAEPLRELLASTDAWPQIAAHVPDFLTCVDRDLKVAYINRTMPPMTLQDVIGSDADTWVAPELREEFRRQVRHVLATGEDVTFAFEMPFGEQAYFVSHMVPLRRGEEIVGVLSSTRNHTAERRAEQELTRAWAIERDASQRLRELDEIKNEFVAKVAHDLRTPITTIRGFADTMLDRWDNFDDEEKRYFLELISRGSDRLMLLVDDILEVAHLESNEFRVSIEPFSVNDLITDLRREFSPQAEAGTVELRCDDQLMALGDPRRVLQVLVNLVSNALQHAQATDPVVVEARPEAGLVRWTVSDNGIGIASDDLPKLFDKFVQVGEEQSHGTGLGLYISRQLVEAQHGRIGVESTVGVGTTLWFTLPSE